MKFYSASFDTIIIRFYLMMAFAISPLIIGTPYLAILSVLFFLAAITGVEFSTGKKQNQKSNNPIMSKIDNSELPQVA